MSAQKKKKKGGNKPKVFRVVVKGESYNLPLFSDIPVAAAAFIYENKEHLANITKDAKKEEAVEVFFQIIVILKQTVPAFAPLTQKLTFDETIQTIQRWSEYKEVTDSPLA